MFQNKDLGTKSTKKQSNVLGSGNIDVTRRTTDPRLTGVMGYDAGNALYSTQSGNVDAGMTNTPTKDKDDGQVKSTGGTAPIERMKTPPSVDDKDIIHLVNAAAIPGEMGKSGAHYIHLVAKGQAVYLYLGEPPDRTALNELTTDLIGSDGKVNKDVDPMTFFSLDGTDVVAGKVKGSASFSTDTRTADDVLKSSNEKSNVVGDASKDPLGTKMNNVWTMMNGGRTELDKKALPQNRRVGEEKKEAAWYNGIEIRKDPVSGTETVHIDRSQYDNRTDPIPELSLDEYHQMLIRDFDYNGAISKFKALGGQSAFLNAVLERFPERDKGELTIIAGEVWSYATTGMDTKGATDIAQMQGYLYALDPKIKVSSDTNTLMGKEFNAGTKEKPLMLKGGDGKHGRATILTTRHLLSNVTFEQIQPKRVTTKETTIFKEFSSRDRFVRDNSPSMEMKWSNEQGNDPNTIVGGIDKVLGRGAFDPAGTTPSIGRNMDATFGGSSQRQIDISNAPYNPNLDKNERTGNGKVIDYSKVLEDAYAKIYPNHSFEDAMAFAGLFKLESKFNAIFKKVKADKPKKSGDARLKSASNVADTYELNGAALRAELGDVNPADATKDAGGESALKTIIATLLYSPQYSDAALEKMDPKEKPRLNAVADEAEQSPEYLELAKKLSKTMGIEVRIIATPSSATSFNPETDLAIVDLNSMQLVEEEPILTSANANKNVAVGQLTFDAIIGGVKQTRTVPVEKRGADVKKEQSGSQKHLQKSFAKLTDKQKWVDLLQ